MNLSELRRRLRQQVGKPSEVQVPNDQLDDAINEAYGHILDRYPHSVNNSWFKFSTLSGEGDYNIPDYIGPIDQVWDVALWKKLPQIPDTNIATLDGRANSRPRGWVRVNNGITLYPQPDGVYEIGVKAKITSAPLASPSDLPMLDGSWHDGIVRRARYEWYDHWAPDATKAREALASWGEWIATKTTIQEQEVVTTLMPVEVPTLAAAMNQAPPRNHFRSNVWGLEDC